MSDGAISQDEIDALLSGVSMDGLNSSGQVSSGPAAHMDVATLQGLADELKPKLESNINSYTNASFTADSPVVELVDRDRVLSRLPEVVIGVMADYNEGVKGEHLYLLAPEFAQKLFSLVNSEEVTEVDDMVLSVVSEVIATHVSAQINSLDATGKLPGLAYATPECVNEPKAMVRFPQGEFALCTYPLTFNGEAFTIWECIAGNVAEKMCSALGGGVEELAAPVADMGMGGMSQPMGGMNMGGMAQPQMNMGMSQPMGGMNMGGMGMAQPQMNMGMGMPQMGMGMPQMNMGMNMGMNVPNVQSLQYPNLQGSMSGAEQGNIGLIMDVQMEMTVELGRTKKSIKEILGMGEGTIIELEKLAGEPVDILVNHKQIAKGEVVVIDENFGVRVTEILSPMERVSDIR